MEIIDICSKLTDPGRQVSDDAALNRLVTYVNNSKELRTGLLNGKQKLIDITQKVLAIGDELPDKNVGQGVWIRLFGQLILCKRKKNYT